MIDGLENIHPPKGPLPTIQQFEAGDRVRIDLSDEEDSDSGRLDGHFATAIDVWRDDTDAATGDERDRYLYQVELTDGETASLRWRDLRRASPE